VAGHSGERNVPNWPDGTPCGCGCGQRKNNCFEGQNLDDSWNALLHSPRPTNEVTRITRPTITGHSFPTIASESSEAHTWVHRSQVEISSPDIEHEAERDWRERHSPITEIRKFIPKTSWKLPCPECGKSWNSNPGDCPNSAHHEHYQKHLKTNRENRRIRE
jgi:hypothetical protein